MGKNTPVVTPLHRLENRMETLEYKAGATMLALADEHGKLRQRVNALEESDKRTTEARAWLRLPWWRRAFRRLP